MAEHSVVAWTAREMDEGGPAEVLASLGLSSGPVADAVSGEALELQSDGDVLENNEGTVEVRWEYQQGRRWVPMDAPTTAQVEMAHRASQARVGYTVAVDAHQKFTYVLDFAQMAQLNMQTHAVRRVRREECIRLPPEVVSGGPQSSALSPRGRAQLVTNWISVDEPAPGEDCSVCLEELAGSAAVVQLPECGHRYHEACAVQWYVKSGAAAFLRCPLCSHIYGSRSGTMPDGTMSVAVYKQHSCTGYEDEPGCEGLICIDYEIPHGIQGPHHPSPGSAFQGTRRRCFLPNNGQGQQALKMLRLAFRRRMTFTVGTSVTSGRSNVVVWDGIHHKTRTDGGAQAYGFPDPGFFGRLADELRNKGITAEDL